MRMPVERIFISEAGRLGIGTYAPHDPTTADIADLVVPLAASGGTYAERAIECGAAVQCRNVRGAGAGVRTAGHGMERVAAGVAAAA